MIELCFLDYETRSTCDLKVHGAYNYAQDASTEVLCISYAFGRNGDVSTWDAFAGAPFPADLRKVLTDDNVRLIAHNAEFDMLMTWYVTCPEHDIKEPELERWYCTATQARANCMPASLTDVGRFVGTTHRKDHRGAQLIRWLSIPKPDGTFNEDLQLLKEMRDYCESDVLTMREFYFATRQLTDEELLDYHVNARINLLGVRIDVPLCEAARKYAEIECRDIEALVTELTEGEVISVRSRKMCQWVYDRVGPRARKFMESYDSGEKKITIDKTARFNLLALAEENSEEIPVHVADVIQCVDDLWSSSVAKFKRFAELADFEDSRARGSFVFAGAVSTGRDASYGLQLHNIPRKAAKNAEVLREAIVKGEPLVPTYGKSVSDVLKSMLRPALIPAPGHVFVIADWSAIEGRVNPWLANSSAGEKKLNVYREGWDPYILNAAPFYSLSYDEIHSGHDEKIQQFTDMRQVGKVMELALGFCAGVGSFDKMAKVYGVKFDSDQVNKAIALWRKNNSWAKEHGTALETAAKRAMRNPGREFAGGRTVYMFDGTHLWYALPSGKILCYPFARLEEGSVSYSNAAWKPKANAKEWPRDQLWIGKYTNNVTQATANDLLRYARRELDDLYYRIVAHTHDEVVVEVPEEDAEEAKMEVERIMTTTPAWAEGLPLAVEADIKKRYSK